jgi:hypothetical protein
LDRKVYLSPTGDFAKDLALLSDDDYGRPQERQNHPQHALCFEVPESSQPYDHMDLLPHFQIHVFCSVRSQLRQQPIFPNKDLDPGDGPKGDNLDNLLSKNRLAVPNKTVRAEHPVDI